MKTKYIIVSLIAFASLSCEDFLDRRLDDAYLKEDVFGRYTTMRDFGQGVYVHLPSQYNRLDGSMLASACDEAVHADENNKINRFGLGSWGPGYNPDDVWSNYYQGIRKANVFLYNSVNFEDILALRDTLTEGGRSNYITQCDDIRKLRAEARFLRAYYYFELGKRYGSVPYFTYPTDLDTDYSRIKQLPFVELVDSIVADCDDIYPVLPVTWENYGIPPGQKEGIGNCPGISSDDRKIGRIIRGAALALKVRALLYAASPLHNPTPTNPERWVKAAQAANFYLEEAAKRPAQVPDLLDDNRKGIFTQRYQKGEIILERRWANNSQFERDNFPIGFSNGGANITAPTQNLVDAFDRGLSSGYHIDGGAYSTSYNPRRPYFQRDTRLRYICIINLDALDADAGATSPNIRSVETFVGGRDGIDKLRATPTGYYLRKYVNTSLDITQGQTAWHTSVLMRLSEVYLSYAEAMNEAYGPDVKSGDGTTYMLTAREAINRIRNKVPVGASKLFNLNVAQVPNDKEKMRIAIQRERQVELSFEEHRFFDIRRWRLMDDPVKRGRILTKRGMRITPKGASIASDTDFNYEPFVVKTDVWDDKMYLYPIPQSEVVKGKLQQNPGW